MKRLVLVLFLVCLPALAAAQIDRATLTGVVRDPSGAVVAAATMAITNDATGIRRSHDHRRRRVPGRGPGARRVPC